MVNDAHTRMRTCSRIHTRAHTLKKLWGNVVTKNYTGFVVELHEGVLDMKGFSSTARQKTVVVQPLSDQN